MIYKETSFAKIVGQMSLSMNTDILTESWVLISVKKSCDLYTDEDSGLGQNVGILILANSI